METIEPMLIRISPAPLSGAVEIPPSKSMSHRALICAALACGESRIDNIIFSKDILATIDAMSAIGAHFKLNAREKSVVVNGTNGKIRQADIDCNESGSTLRFTIPLTCALGISAVFRGKGKLPSRPITPYITEFQNHGVVFDYHSDMPFSVSGKLTAGNFYIDGGVSSQFITGLLFALPLLEEDSEIHIVGELQSKPYADMTLFMLKKYGIDITETDFGYRVCACQRYLPTDYTVEADFSQAAFFLVGSAAKRNNIICKNLDLNSIQGDRQIIDILKGCGAKIDARLGISASAKSLLPFEADAKNIPDLVPILCVLATMCDGKSVIKNIERLRIKESDRVESSIALINSLGGRAYEDGGKIVVEGSRLSGGTVNSFNDHRIAMAAAIACSICSGDVTIESAQAVEKSYPDFYEDYKKLGGNASVIDMEQ